MLHSFLKKADCLLLSGMLALLVSSCGYSVRIANKNGTAEPDPTSGETGFYRQKEVHVIDTVVNLKLLDNEAMMLERCPMGCFYSLEYRVTFGGILLNTVTFGKKKKVRVKYVCLKDSNE